MKGLVNNVRIKSKNKKKDMNGIDVDWLPRLVHFLVEKKIVNVGR